MGFIFRESIFRILCVVLRMTLLDEVKVATIMPYENLVEPRSRLC